MSIRKFDTLTPRGKAVRIAKDVLLQLKAKKYEAKNMVYFTWDAITKLQNDSNIPWDTYREIETKLYDVDLKETLSKIKKCTVCALGASICSLANLNGPVQVRDALNGGKQDLIAVFGQDQLSAIESAFEKQGMGVCRDYDLRERAIAFGKKYKFAENRLKAIMTNIIKNRGVFKP